MSNRYMATMYLGKVPGSSDPKRPWALYCGHTHREIRLADKCARRMRKDYPGWQVVVAARFVPTPGHE